MVALVVIAGLIVFARFASRIAARLLGRRWWYLVPPDHCVYFNKVALGMALERAGYVVTKGGER